MSNIKNKIIALFVTVLMIITMLLVNEISLVKAEESIITVFSVEDYIHEAEDDTEEGVLDTFKNETGITVNYVTFATNEEMYNELTKDPYAVDLICPSEYMIMKMMSEDLIRSFETPKNFMDYGSPYIKEVFKGLNIKKGEQTIPFMSADEKTSYTVGYMWGTIGLIYNMQPKNGSPITEQDLSSWANIWKKFTKKVTIKDSIRDSYFMALAYVYKTELLQAKAQFELDADKTAYNAKLTEIFNRTDAASVLAVEKALLDLKNNLYGFEVDAGKNDILTGKIDVNVAWSGDAVCAIGEGLEDADGNIKEEAVRLGFVVPEEGSNIWFDGYVMTKNADYDKSIKFLDFIARPDIAVKNMDYTGYTSCIAGDEVLTYIQDSYDSDEGAKTYDLTYFFEPNYTGDKYLITVEENYLSMFEAQYPTEDIITRCAVMQNFQGEDLERVNEMWKKVKLITLSNLSIILILVGVALVIVGIVLYKFKGPIVDWIESIFQKNKKEIKYKVVKIEKIN